MIKLVSETTAATTNGLFVKFINFFLNTFNLKTIELNSVLINYALMLMSIRASWLTLVCEKKKKFLFANCFFSANAMAQC